MSILSIAPLRFEGISVVVPFYQAQDTVDAVYQGLVPVLERLGHQYEMVFVDDGSTDATPDRLQAVWSGDDRVTVLRFSRNFGQRTAWTAGLAEARGGTIVTIDGDGQLDPEDIPGLLAALEAGADIASGVRAQRRDPLFRKAFTWLANWCLRRFGRLVVSDFGCGLRAYRGAFLDRIDFGPHRLYDKAAALSLTDAVANVPVRHYPQARSLWRVSGLMRYGIDNLITFGESFFTQLAIWAGCGLALALIAIGLAVLRLDLSVALVPLTLLVAVWLTLLGTLVGFAASRAVRQTSGQPCYIIRDRLPRRWHSEADPCDS